VTRQYRISLLRLEFIGELHQAVTIRSPTRSLARQGTIRLGDEYRGVGGKGSALKIGFRRKTPYVLVGRIRRFVRGGGAC